MLDASAWANLRATLEALAQKTDTLEAAANSVHDDLIREDFSVRIIPNGAGDGLPPIPDIIDAEADADSAIARWDEAMHDYAGLLTPGEEE